MGRAWSPDTLKGARLGSCLLEEVLGTGGMGAVYLAQQERPRRRVAVKVLHRDSADDPEAWKVFLARFRREADATAALDHANIVPIYAFGEKSGLAYLVMPYLADGSLAGLIKREGTLTLPRAARYIEQVAAGLDYAHQQGIVHRDVKASNVLLHPDGRLLLTDFGIARPLAAGEMTASGSKHLKPKADDPELTQAGAVMGTPEYMAPEQVRGEPVTPATDIYALGVLTYAMLAGKAPFTGPDTAGVLTQQLTAPPPSLRAARPDVSAEVEKAVQWALAKDPAQRPPSAGAFARALRLASERRDWDSAVGARSARVAVGAGQERTPVQTLPLAEMARRVRVQSGTFGGNDRANVALDESPTIGGGRSVYWSTQAAGDGTPAWPVPVRPARGGGTIWQPALILLAAVGVIVLAIALVVSLLNAGGTSTTTGGTSAPTTAGGHTLATVTPTPTFSPSPTRSTPANWLSVAPRSVKLGCSGSNHSATVTLSDAGPSDVGWQAQISPPNQFAILVTPGSGDVGAGGSTDIVLTNRSTFIGGSGTVYFVPDNPQAGRAAGVRFTTAACRP